MANALNGVCDKKLLYIENVHKSGKENEIVESLKKDYRLIINSNRRLERTTEIKGFFKLVEKLCIQDETKLFEKLEKLCPIRGQDITNPKIIMKTETLDVQSHQPLYTENTSFNNCINKYEPVIKFLSEELGKEFWKEFARQLDIKQGFIAELEDKYRTALQNGNKLPKELVKDIISEFENNLICRKLYCLKILEAIKKERDDLCEKLMLIMMKNKLLCDY